MVKRKKSRTTKRDAETTLEKEESSIKRFQNRNDMPKDICQIYSNWQAMAQGSWIGQPMNNNYVTPYPPLHLNMVDKQKQINLKMHCQKMKRRKF